MPAGSTVGNGPRLSRFARPTLSKHPERELSITCQIKAINFISIIIIRVQNAKVWRWLVWSRTLYVGGLATRKPERVDVLMRLRTEQSLWIFHELFVFSGMVAVCCKYLRLGSLVKARGPACAEYSGDPSAVCNKHNEMRRRIPLLTRFHSLYTSTQL